MLGGAHPRLKNILRIPTTLSWRSYVNVSTRAIRLENERHRQWRQASQGEVSHTTPLAPPSKQGSRRFRLSRQRPGPMIVDTSRKPQYTRAHDRFARLVWW
jgi:hypothetical protein